MGPWAGVNGCGEQKIFRLHGLSNHGTLSPWRVIVPTALSRAISCGVVLLIKQIWLSLKFISLSLSTVRRYISCDIDCAVK